MTPTPEIPEPEYTPEVPVETVPEYLIPVSDRTCTESTPFIEVTNDNILQIIKLLKEKRETLKKGGVEDEDICYCTFAPQNVALLQLTPAHSVQQLLFNSRLRMRV